MPRGVGEEEGQSEPVELQTRKYRQKICGRTNARLPTSQGKVRPGGSASVCETP